MSTRPLDLTTCHDRLLRSTLLAALLMLAGAGPALAGKNDGDRAFAEFEVTETQALEIAKAQGIALVSEVKARRGVWKFEGLDAEGVSLEFSSASHSLADAGPAGG